VSPSSTSVLQPDTGSGQSPPRRPLGRFPASPALQPGQGVARVARVDGRSRVIRSRATNPLKLWSPRRPGTDAWIYSTTFGGGLVSGDRVQLDLDIEPDATAVLTTQASTKVYRSLRSRPCSQQLTARLGSAATLVITPDPLVCFRGAIYEQFNRIHLADDSSLVHIDWLTSGRSACGECWKFARLATRLEVIRDRQMLLLDSLTLDPRDGALDGPLRMGDYHCLATVVILGPPLENAAATIREDVDDSNPDSGCLEAASPLAEGTIWRILGPTTEAVGTRLRQRLAFLADHLDETPWNRKW